jgi:hypothetical protein
MAQHRDTLWAVYMPMMWWIWLNIYWINSERIAKAFTMHWLRRIMYCICMHIYTSRVICVPILYENVLVREEYTIIHSNLPGLGSRIVKWNESKKKKSYSMQLIIKKRKETRFIQSDHQWLQWLECERWHQIQSYRWRLSLIYWREEEQRRWCRWHTACWRTCLLRIGRRHFGRKRFHRLFEDKEL